MSTKYSSKLQKRLRNLRAAAYDFDGVMTDNRVIVSSDGVESVICHRGDGWGVAQLKKMGLRQCVISTETNPVVSKRAEKLGILCIQGCQDKFLGFKEFASRERILLEQIAYIGNDVNDLPAMLHAGVKVAPRDAAPEVLAIADLVTRSKGGHGVIYDWWKILGSVRAWEGITLTSLEAQV